MLGKYILPRQDLYLLPFKLYLFIDMETSFHHLKENVSFVIKCKEHTQRC